MRFSPLCSRILSLVVALVALLPLSASDAPTKDRVYQRTGPMIEAAEVVTEALDNVSYRLTPGAQPIQRRSAGVSRVEYAGMFSGSYQAGQDALDRGAYDEAADRFQQVANGENEWEKVYGGIALGSALEMAKRYADAAKAYNAVATAFPKHRLILDVHYRKGMAQALAKDAGAEKTAAALSELSKGTIGQPAEARASAIRAAIAMVAGDAGKADGLARKATLRPDDDRETWFHFNLWLADTYRLTGKTKEVSRTIDAMIGSLEAEPARRAQALAIKGLALVESDPQAAIIELVKLDALPFGSEELRCEARLAAGKAMLAEAKALAANPDTAKDERKSSFVKEMNRTARTMIQAAADSLTTVPAKGQAKTLLATLPAQ